MSDAIILERLRRTPPLENGDRLSRAEFERRYEAMPNHIKEELIEGVVQMSSGVRGTTHGIPHADLGGRVGSYRAYIAGTDSAVSSTLRLDLDNEPQPDVVLYIGSECGGRATIDRDNFIAAAPELVLEVAASSVSIELSDKKTAFRRNGVKEYIVWRVLDDEMDWFILRDSGYEQLPADAAGIVKSETFPGLWLDRPAMLRRDLAAVLRLLQQGLASSEHARFVASLQAARQP
jgi:Uma2 family endonuclease